MGASGEEFRRQQETSDQLWRRTEEQAQRIQELEAALQRSMSVATGLIPKWTPALRRWLLSAARRPRQHKRGDA